MAGISGDVVVPESARKLAGKVALITGGASGIGECTARLFAKHGARVVVADIQDEAGARLCGELGEGNASYVQCDVTVEEEVAAAVDHAVARFGALDVMFNNAGIGGEACHSILESSKADFERVLSVNLVGPFLGTKHAARVMVPAGRGGCIIGTASMAAAVAGAASHAYTCAKRGLVGLTVNAAGELGRHGIRVNCVSPAAAATPLATRYVGLEGEAFEAAMEAVATLKGVRLRVEDIAAAVLFLASDDARYVSGHNLLIDGGFSVFNPTLGIFNDS
ncbi:momilactone A synthase-like [Oryza brachyantha]|uniref:Momilactone A synthase n=1 Tax=Oryza brachyantha TaxID=4533 RepID=J3LXI7_ORYBR|nr:momilactone A synthase-like [Oryza brachyantha]